MSYLGWFRFGLVVAAVSMALGCSGKDEDNKNVENQAPELVSVWLTPRSIKPGGVLTANASAVDPEDDPCRIEYKWYVNGKVVEGAEGAEFDSGSYGPGDKIHSSARAVEVNSGRASAWKDSGVVKIGDYPAIKLGGVTIKPSAVYSFNPVEAEINYGPTDPDDVDEIFYLWFLNGSTLADAGNDSPELDDGYFSVGDWLQVWASANEDFPSSQTVKSPRVEVWNSPPKFDDTPEMEVGEDAVYIYAEAIDLDGEPIEYFLKQGPPTASIDKSSGTVTIDFYDAQPGRYSVTVGAKDRHGGSAFYSTGITVPDNAKKQNE